MSKKFKDIKRCGAWRCDEFNCTNYSENSSDCNSNLCHICNLGQSCKNCENYVYTDESAGEFACEYAYENIELQERRKNELQAVEKEI